LVVSRIPGSFILLQNQEQRFVRIKGVVPEAEVRRKREKGHWLKRSEQFRDGSAARSRAAEFRQHAYVAPVKTEKSGTGYTVRYSVAKWYLEELLQSGLKL